MPAPPLPRLASIGRSQLLLHTVDIERLIDEDQSARSIWHLVGRINLGLYHAKVATLVEPAKNPVIKPVTYRTVDHSSCRVCPDGAIEIAE
jgi:hypothetical protein